ncbi:MAG: bifunctional transaldolase/phosoglucose isomerase [Myxococcales bacterium]|nr:bifunctional transaldolase/phosoglucose isomerase [Myxococcales bacterium]
MKSNAQRAHAAHGLSIWLDGLRRGTLASGEFARLIREGVRGAVIDARVTEQAISGATDYDDALRRLVGEGASVQQIQHTFLVEDAREAADALRPVFEQSKESDGYVSCPLPGAPRDTESMLSAASELFKAVRRENLLVQIPATPGGMRACELLAEEGISIHMTLVFDVERAEHVAFAFRQGFAKLKHNRARLWLGPTLNRLDAEIDRQLKELVQRGGDEATLEGLLGKAGIASARQLLDQIQSWPEAQGDAPWIRLLVQGTATTDPHQPSDLYASALLGPLVRTQSFADFSAFQDLTELAAPLAQQRDPKPVLSALTRTGINLENVGSELRSNLSHDQGRADEQLQVVIMARREALLEQAPERQRLSLGDAPRAVVEALKSLGRQQAPSRLWSVDPTLFTTDAAHEASIRSRLGWLHSPARMRAHLDDLSSFSREMYRAGFRRALLLGMGGSSLCPEVLAATYGSTPGFLELRTLDSTDPDAVNHAADWADLDQTLFIVASKSGSTLEVRSFEAYFFERCRERFGDSAGSRFIAITDPGTPLVELAKQRGYARVFENDPNIGGRYSAMSFFGLVPAALIGADLEALVGDAERMAVGCAPVVPSDDNPGLRLGAFMAGLAKNGRDKLTLICSPEVQGLGSWIEQLVAESTGKQGRGVIPVDLEPLGAPDTYGDDRAFVYVRYGGRNQSPLDLEVDQLVTAGHPVARIGMLAQHDLGGEFFRREIATASTGPLLGVNPFDEPNVTEAKQETAKLIAEFEATHELAAPPAHAPDSEALAQTLDCLRPGDYLVLSAYFERTPERDAIFSTIRERLRTQYRVATTLGYGPRFLHSTGQLHIGGPGSGVFVVLTRDRSVDLSIPGKTYSFGTLRDAQAFGDLAVLERKQRRACHVGLGGDVDAGLTRLLSALG